jgi:protein O-GlcNAc transferase
MAQNRMLLFARKPAPVQVAWLAYPGSTGLDTIDYRLTDSYMDPPDSDQSWSAEQAIRLPDSWCCYQAMEELPIYSNLPADRAGHICFGSLNNFKKLNENVLRLWTKVLAAVPESRLLLLGGDELQKKWVCGTFEGGGISADRIEFLLPCPRSDYLKGYERIDIALDPFPYNGITTTCDALWMGVPVISFAGDRPSARAGLGLLTVAGFPEFVAHSPDEFITLAANLAGDLNELRSRRKSIAIQMRESPLADANRFARNVEKEYRQMWRKWCKT